MVAEIQVTNKSTGKTFAVICEAAISDRGNCRVFYRVFEAACSMEIKSGIKNLYISEYEMKKAKKAVESFFNVKLSNTPVQISITDESWNTLKDFEAEAIERANKLKAEYQAKIDAQPRKYARYDFLDWGDYKITQERKIFQVYLSLDSDRWVIEETIANLNDSRIGEYSDEWEAITGESIKVGNYRDDLGIIEVSEDEALKWVGRSVEANQKAENEKAEKERIKAEKEAAAKAERQAKFDQAKKTGKPVLLYSTFVTNNDIPRQYRDEDSDMGHLNVYAMPDGTTSESFSHAY